MENETSSAAHKAKDMTTKTTHDPMDREKFRDEVKARLEEIGDQKRAAAFAARMALAALPRLADGAEKKGFLWYWEEEREKHLFAVCRALQVGWSVLSDSLLRICWGFRWELRS